MVAKPSAALLRAIADTPEHVSQDKLDQLRSQASHLADLQAERQYLEDRLAEVGRQITEMRTRTLPDMLTDAGVDRIGISAHGNMPAQEAVRKKFYAAGIAAKWPDEKKAISYKYLEEAGAGDLIKTTITLDIDRLKRAEARALEAQLRGEGWAPVVRLSVNTQTLTAWLKEQIEVHGVMPDLEKIGGAVGSIVDLKPRKA